MRELFVRLHVEGDSATQLETDFPDIVASGSAKVAIETLCATRTAAFELLPAEDAKEQYLAMTYLIAAQSLTMYEFQAATARATLAAIHPSFVAAVA